MDPVQLARLAARLEALEEEKAALIRRVMRGEGELRDAQELTADIALRLSDAEASLHAERNRANTATRERDALRNDFAAQAMVLREIPELTARCAELEAALAATNATEADQARAKEGLDRALAAERSLRKSLEDAFADETMARAEIEASLAASHGARAESDKALALEKRQRASVEAALAASGELLRAAEERFALAAARVVPEPLPIQRAAPPASTRAFPVSDPPASSAPASVGHRENRVREKVLRDELTLLGTRNDALVDLSRHALRALERVPGSGASIADFGARLATILAGVAPGEAEPRVASALVSSFGGTLRIDANRGEVVVDFSQAPRPEPSDFGEPVDPEADDAFLLFVAFWASSVYLASKMAQVAGATNAHNAPNGGRIFRFAPASVVAAATLGQPRLSIDDTEYDPDTSERITRPGESP